MSVPIEALMALGIDTSAINGALEKKRAEVEKLATEVDAAARKLAEARARLATAVENYNAVARAVGKPHLTPDGRPADRATGWILAALATFKGRRTGDFNVARTRVRVRNCPSRALQFLAAALIAAGNKGVRLTPIPSSSDRTDSIDEAVRRLIDRSVLAALYKAADSDGDAASVVAAAQKAAGAEWPAIKAGLTEREGGVEEDEDE
jgi:hypothetical protein